MPRHHFILQRSCSKGDFLGDFLSGSPPPPPPPQWGSSSDADPAVISAEGVSRSRFRPKTTFSLSVDPWAISPETAAVVVVVVVMVEKFPDAPGSPLEKLVLSFKSLVLAVE